MDNVVPRHELRRPVDGFQVSQGLSVMGQLGIADLLAGGGPHQRRPGRGAAALTRPRRIGCCGRWPAAAGCTESDGRRFEPGRWVRVCVPTSTRRWPGGRRSSGRRRPGRRRASGHSVRTGSNAFQHVHGTDVCTYRSPRPDDSVSSTAPWPRCRSTGRDLVASYDFTPFGTIADIGGGTGFFRLASGSGARSVRRSGSTCRDVAVGAEAVLHRRRRRGRREVESATPFYEVPAGADAYVLRAVVHDWDDEDACASWVRSASYP